MFIELGYLHFGVHWSTTSHEGHQGGNPAVDTEYRAYSRRHHRIEQGLVILDTYPDMFAGRPPNHLSTNQ